MKSVQRRFGTFMKRSENEADVATVIADFKAVDDMLDKLIKDIKAWRDAWQDVLKFQYDTTEAFVALYKPIDATGEVSERRHRDEQTPENYMQKALGLQKDYSEEKTDLSQEMEEITYKLLRPAEEAKQRTKLLHKTLKHRENTKLDYERYLSRVEHARKKENRSAKDEQALQAQEANMAQSRIDYQTADEHVKQNIPPLTAAVLSLLRPLLEQQIKLNATLCGQLYTVLDAYTKKYGFPNPAPADAEILRTFDHEFTSFRKELESGISVIARGKVVHTSIQLPQDTDKSTVTGFGIRNKVMPKKETKPAGLPGRATSGTVQDHTDSTEDSQDSAPPKPPRPGGYPSPVPSPGPGMMKTRIGSTSSIPTNGTYNPTFPPPPPYDYKPTALIPTISNPDYAAGGAATPPSRYQTPANGSSPLLSPQYALSPPSTIGLGGGTGDYFSNARRPSQTSIASSAASIAAAKKKPPPPVPVKRMPSAQSQFVTALYDFEGQSAGDLAFREGDRIRVVKKTESTDDWWDGELKGKTGAFPANYVQI